MSNNVLIGMSGGLDSTVLAYYAKQQGLDVIGQPFVYGSKHNIWEKDAVDSLACLSKTYKDILNTIDLSEIYSHVPKTKMSLLKGGSTLPAGHYKEDSMRQTVIPGRNLIFISVMSAIAESLLIDQIMLGVHAGDHFIYPDCREAFINAASDAVLKSSDGKVRLYAPFLEMDKKQIVEMGIRLDVPFVLTRTCYSDKEVACGVCGSCQERLEAFKLNGIEDPLPYESRELLPKKQ